jgi:hypothetical protein
MPVLNCPQVRMPFSLLTEGYLPDVTTPHVGEIPSGGMNFGNGLTDQEKNAGMKNE